METKEIIKIVKGYYTKDGAGVSLIRVIGHDDIHEADPFLMLDAFDSANPANYIKGFPMHPHRGIETVTYMIEGEIDHRDSLGNHGSIKSGEIQWMTAGSGILHEEMPQKVDRLFGLQLWINLPKKDKMTAPRYFDISKEMIKSLEIDGGVVRIIAGKFGGVSGIKPGFVQVTMLDITLRENKELLIPLDNESKAIIYTLEGDGNFGKYKRCIENRNAAIFGKGNSLFVKAGEKGVRFVLFAGNPLKEPVSWGGPIVMNTRGELETAYNELHNGTFIK